MSNINVQVAEVNDAFFNPRLADNPCVSRYNLRKADFANTMTDIYEFMGDLNVMSVERGWGRFEDMLQLQALSNVLSKRVTRNDMGKTQSQSSNAVSLGIALQARL